ncbi:TFIIB-type zinc ribbon-containing protein [Auraticoccus monumenti]|uniref:Transcription factor zinc-finger domain-containing protein n=1 Tax=Auraticoccus monumenti TaxID=675864 RepID=A0A1G6V5L5_9ACTN|nr:zf-TFIIB domain-containing protein [Auraticoccus monumenti]SDD48980.1 hypothetical protein SAMN04489747_1054 [Auraticoccus monumenti]
MELRCPKCESPMRQYERNGITIDQCSQCKGIFLDRGELERLSEAEGSYYAQASAPPPPGYPAQPGGYPPPQAAMPYQQQRWGSPGSPDSPHHYGQQGHRRRRKSFLGELFD